MKKLFRNSTHTQATSSETQENNKLIAEFMGGVLSSVPNVINLPQKIGEVKIHCVNGSELLPNGTYKVCRITELKYHSDWNWLMEVVKKCRVESNEEDSHWEAIYYSLSDLDIDNVYTAVISFIKWYNETNNETNKITTKL